MKSKPTFLQSRELFYKWNFDPYGVKTIWCQISGHLENAKVQIWTQNDNFQSFQFCSLLHSLDFGRYFSPLGLHPNEGHFVDCSQTGAQTKTKLRLFWRRLCPQVKAFLAAIYYGDFVLKWRPFRRQIGTQTKAILAKTLLSNEGCFSGELAPKRRPFRWQIGTQTMAISTMAISTVNWHLKEGQFGGELAPKQRPFLQDNLRLKDLNFSWNIFRILNVLFRSFSQW